MGYIPQNALENLKKYSYRGVDKCVIASSLVYGMLSGFEVRGGDGRELRKSDTLI